MTFMWEKYRAYWYGQDPKIWKFRIRGRRYEPEEGTMLDWAAVKNLAALDDCTKTSVFMECCETEGGFGYNLDAKT